LIDVAATRMREGHRSDQADSASAAVASSCSTPPTTPSGGHYAEHNPEEVANCEQPYGVLGRCHDWSWSEERRYFVRQCWAS
jgi:hypothetical protein